MFSRFKNGAWRALRSFLRGAAADPAISLHVRDGGFVCERDGQIVDAMRWGDVHGIDAYWSKGANRNTITLVFYRDRPPEPMRISTEQRGWDQVIDEMQQVFPEIKRDWQFDVPDPYCWPAAPDFNVLYRRS
jgi:hypothetical protein